MSKELRKKSQLAWGICVICILFLLETWNANRLLPNRASPLIWSLLRIGAAVSAGLALWFARAAKRAGNEP